MTDHEQELIADYLLGELDPTACERVERRLATDPEFARALTRLEETLALGLLAETPAAEPAAELRQRVLADLAPAAGEPAAMASAPADARVIAFPRWLMAGWGVAAALAVLASVLGTRLRDRTATVSTLQLELTSARDTLDSVSHELAAVFLQRDLLTERIAALESRRTMDRLRIATLSSQVQQAAAYGFAVFDPASDEGVIEVINLPQIDSETQDYQLWVVDPQYANPVDGGIITIDGEGRSRVRFQAGQPVSEVAAFAVSLERKGGVPVAEGPMILVGAL